MTEIKRPPSPRRSPPDVLTLGDNLPRNVPCADVTVSVTSDAGIGRVADAVCTHVDNNEAADLFAIPSSLPPSTARDLHPSAHRDSMTRRNCDTEAVDQPTLPPSLPPPPECQLRPSAHRETTSRENRYSSIVRQPHSPSNNAARHHHHHHQEHHDRQMNTRSIARMKTVIGNREPDTISLRTSAKASSVTKSGSVKRVGLFVTRLHPDTTDLELNAHIQKATNLRLRTQKLKAKFTSYASFFVPLAQGSWDYLLNADVWPQGVLVKEFK